jgi:hypothetical protein
MSEQQDGFLEIAPAYNFDRKNQTNYRSRTIESSTFHKWTSDSMYKSSYAHFHSKVILHLFQESTQPKNSVIPGYGGYIPSIKAENIHARGYSAMAKQSFNQSQLGKINGLSTTGFNLNREALIDQSKIASSSKYGKT